MKLIKIRLTKQQHEVVEARAMVAGMQVENFLTWMALCGNEPSWISPRWDDIPPVSPDWVLSAWLHEE